MNNLFDFTNDMTEQQSKEQNIKAVKLLRVHLNTSLNDLRSIPNSRANALAITKVEEAIMWLGKRLRELDEQTPYTEEMNPENTIIHPEADKETETVIEVVDMWAEDKNTHRINMRIEQNGETIFDVGDGDCKDNTIRRNFNDCVNVLRLLQEFYKLGLEGKKVEFDTKEVDWDEM